MSTSTYVYGTPRGFNLYEDAASLKDVFLSYYISDRQGARLLVTRNKDGNTRYTYLRYGLLDSGSRSNAFFGMTIAIDGFKYCEDFILLYDWFTTLFHKLVERGNLLFRVGEGVIQYKRSSFKDASEEVEWLKTQMPKIFTSGRAILTSYTSTFKWPNSARVCLHNNTDTREDIISDFRNYNSVSISPLFQKSISLDYSEYQTFINESTKLLLDLALSTDKNAVRTKLSPLRDGFTQMNEQLEEYLTAQKRNPSEEYDKFIDIKDSFTKLGSQISKLNSDVSKPEPPAPPVPPNPPVITTRKVCAKCGREKTIDDFPYPASPICSQCAKQSATRTCVKCKRQLPVSYFNGKSHICHECLCKSKPANSFDFITFFKTHIKGIRITGRLIAFVVIVGLLFFIFNENTKIVEKAKVEKGLFNEDLSNGFFDKCLADITGKSDSAEYIVLLRKQYNRMMNYNYNQTQNSYKTKFDESPLVNFFRQHPETTKALTYNTDSIIENAHKEFYKNKSSAYEKATCIDLLNITETTDGVELKGKATNETVNRLSSVSYTRNGEDAIKLTTSTTIEGKLNDKIQFSPTQNIHFDFKAKDGSFKKVESGGVEINECKGGTMKVYWDNSDIKVTITAPSFKPL